MEPEFNNMDDEMMWISFYLFWIVVLLLIITLS